MVMRRYIQYDSFNIYSFDAASWKHPVHKHTYYEIIFIMKGAGMHTVNGNSFRYKSGDVFLLGPEDYHEFMIHTRTTFCYLRFLETVLLHIDERPPWQRLVNQLLQAPQVVGSRITSAPERQQVFHLLTVLRAEYEQQGDHFLFLRDGILKAMVSILVRETNKLLSRSGKRTAVSEIEKILIYIRQHIQDPERLRLKHMAEQFHYSPSYLGIFFKQHTGESIKQYITTYKLTQIEGILLYSRESLSAIADKFGFTDESHLSKQFKKYKGTSPRAFRLNDGNSLRNTH